VFVELLQEIKHKTAEKTPTSKRCDIGSKVVILRPMKQKFLLFIGAICLTAVVFSHDYHFAFLEMEYYPTEQQFQASLKVTAHDLAFITSKKHGQDLTMDQILRTDSLRLELEQYVLSGFSLFQNTQQVYFKVDGHELTENGELVFYFSSESIVRNGLLTFAFPLLTNYFPDQQNKLDFLKHGKHHTLTYLATDNTKQINVAP
jgi:hypothetical protein